MYSTVEISYSTIWNNLLYNFRINESRFHRIGKIRSVEPRIEAIGNFEGGPLVILKF